ncbi:hypothetical protein EO087_01370 [Dyella sp. M7H15-1]|uniref:choice-of-anchor tandem repeat GloVer-containing protein n=1 Tax=Dyella sp. M7H15-1 TaxID=2501295 RepID=UPI001004E028|nr:choice-of-anchor tandem repeat GloVer-containing protein [Dyella sp. M7H15-1]QAU22797.1 hypothetical protein EO087_01370 [Dyella sp. M7H15-1]
MSKFYRALKLSVMAGFTWPLIMCHAGEAAMSNSNSAHALSTVQISPQVGVENHDSVNSNPQLEGAVNRDGSNPQAGLIQGQYGNFYGTTVNGGVYGKGTVFKVTPQSGNTFKETVVHSFGEGEDGANPKAGLIQVANGDLYGTTYNGGRYGKGTVFMIPHENHRKIVILHSFNGFTNSVFSNGDSADGAYPQAGLILGKDGNFYGTTYYGGASGYGTVFKMVDHGVEGTVTVLHSFGLDDGMYPEADLILTANGDLYGTTYESWDAYGTAFKLARQSDDSFKEETVLHPFYGDSPAQAYDDGSYPEASLIQGKDNNEFFGTTESGGNREECGCGVIFKISTSGFYEQIVLLSQKDGGHPQAGLIVGKDGDLYGTASAFGAYNKGTVFKIMHDDDGIPKDYHLYYKTIVLHSFFGGSDGDTPRAGLIQGTDGYFYGTTYYGGTLNRGTVFQIKPDGTEGVVYAFGSGR